MERAFAELIRRTHDHYELVVFSSDLGHDLRGLVEWRRVPVPGRPVPLRFVLFYLLGAVRLARADADLIHTLGAIVPNAADLASVHFCNAGLIDAAGARAPRDAPLLRRINTGLTNALGLIAERWSYRPGRVEWLAPVSDGLARELERHFGGPRVRVAPNGVDHARFRPAPEVRAEVRRELGVEHDEVVVLFVGGDWHRKGLGLALEAFGRATRSSTTTLRLVVVGRGDERHFDRLARRLGVAEQVLFLGPRGDTERFYAAADVFLLPSCYETFSLAAFEAAACGLPIVASRVSGVEELVGDDQAGFVVRRDPEEIAAALILLAGSPTTRRRLGEAARERCAPFTWDRSAAAVESIYRSVLGQHERNLKGVAA
jgi:glycosyltransferase involved in cell wall biosynthesis